jgi:hypothetical protein
LVKIRQDLITVAQSRFQFLMSHVYYTRVEACQLRPAGIVDPEQETQNAYILADKCGLPMQKKLIGGEMRTVPVPGWPKDVYRPCITYTLDVEYCIVRPAEAINDTSVQKTTHVLSVANAVHG